MAEVATRADRLVADREALGSPRLLAGDEVCVVDVPVDAEGASDQPPLLVRHGLDSAAMVAGAWR